MIFMKNDYYPIKSDKVYNINRKKYKYNANAKNDNKTPFVV